MACKGVQITVGAGSPVQLNTIAGDSGSSTTGARCLVRNRHASITVALGGSDVTAAAGFALLAGEGVAIDLDVGEKLYGIAASSTVTVHVLEGGI